jgi:hypothetical protein
MNSSTSAEDIAEEKEVAVEELRPEKWHDVASSRGRPCHKDSQQQ